MSTKRFITREDFSWLASRSFIKHENGDVIWKALRDTEAIFTVHEEDFSWLEGQKLDNISSWKDAIRDVRKLLRDRCGKRIVVSENDLEVLQRMNLLSREGNEEVSNIWKELCDRCPLVDKPSYSTTELQLEPDFVFNENLVNNLTPTYDVCVVYSNTGVDIANIIMNELKKLGLCCCPFSSESFYQTEAERRISNSIATIAILTTSCLETKEMIFALQAASFHYKESSRIILVHSAESCYFPVAPESVSKCFGEKAITWLSCYVNEGVQQIVQKFNEEKKSWQNSLNQETVQLRQEDLTTRVFLSHKRSTGQGIVGRLYEGLKDSYKVFLDSETKFKIHDLQLIVENTTVFIFVLTHGILLSHWCLQELLSAVAHSKQIIIIRDLAYSLPSTLPPAWASVEHILRAPNQLLWIAEYNFACIAALKKRIGSPDKYYYKGLAEWPKCQPKLEAGVLENMNELEEGVIQVLMEMASSLKQVNLREHKCITDDALKILSEKHHDLQHLNLHHCEKITDTGLQALSEGCPRIQTIDLYKCSKITDKGLKFLSQECHNIQYIDLSEDNLITNGGLKALSEGCHDIQTISLSKCIKITDEGLKFLSEGCRKIELINITNCNKITDAGLKFLSEGCPNIHTINLYYANKITDVGLQALSKGCHNIRTLNLYYCDQITDTGLKSLAEGSPIIQNIDLYNCSKITNAGLKALSEYCHAIQNLNLSKCNITDDGLKFLSEGCSDIHTLDLSNCSITDSGLKFLSQGCHNIKNIKLYHMYSKITDAGLKTLADGCPNIEDINLYYCNKITDEGLNILAAKCHSIQKINLYFCNQVTDTGLKFLSEGCPNLNYINIYQCNQITTAGLQSLYEVFPKITVER